MKHASLLPAPLTPEDADLADFQYMKLDVRRLRDSRIASAISGEEFRCAVLLWCAAWHQKPASSLPDDDLELSQLAGFGRALSEWLKVREGALYGWIKCADGRLYHPVVAEKANEAWAEKLAFRWKRECDRLRKVNKARQENGLDPLPLPLNPAEPARPSNGTEQLSNGMDQSSDGNAGGFVGKADPSDGILGFSSETDGSSSGNLSENALRGKGKGRGIKERKNAGPPLCDGNPGSSDLHRPTSPSDEADLFRRAKQILGNSSGGLISKLLKSKSGNIALARSAVEIAATKADPREYVGAVIRGSPEAKTAADLLAEQRARGDRW
ncbi:hypothetical protein Msil_2767 [Methylocella silvestris BL2]|uniref:DUF1376 domain-containing protein n=1 Tax=Methylocella silvestris (strain DSM 15510 / CIP 108128 / LMG 27833 / NCIMB 13906 / BL2) TaxID=395965 RepID=B8ERY9_METSB|nr:DUF1376 domain-containing protein [Methylocella silvestris]ACK51687.1 hypothetical protein Msil_2767 [Methylocella silvestris BL2]